MERKDKQRINIMNEKEVDENLVDLMRDAIKERDAIEKVANELHELLAKARNNHYIDESNGKKVMNLLPKLGYRKLRTGQ